jgi:3-oxoacyl-[acyl-carrier protein] reductase
MDLGLRDKVALVGASSGGLGFAVADSLAAEGARLIICARNLTRLQAARSRLACHSGQVIAVQADLATTEGVESVVRAGAQTFGRIDVLVTNTGGPPPGTFESHSAQVWDQATALLLKSAVELTRRVLPGMRHRKWGRILGITSMAVKQPAAGLILSNSLRAAVTGFFRTLANEVAADGITVNTLLPGYTDTERLKEFAQATAAARGTTADTVHRRWVDAIPMQRLGTPEEFAAAVTFLASERASYITGQALVIDGGYTRSLL